MSELRLYRTYSHIEDAKELIELLEKNKIRFSIVENAYDVDVTFSGNKTQSDIQILINPEHFEAVDRLSSEKAEDEIQYDYPDHYLQDFSVEELMEIIQKKDEWSEFDFQLALKILEKRGKKIDEEELNEIILRRKKERSKPEESSQIQIFAGYFFAILGGLLGLIIGWLLWKHKKTTPLGDRVYTYTEEHRKHGKQIFILGLVAILIWTLLMNM